MSKLKKLMAAVVSLTMAATMAATVSACKEDSENTDNPGVTTPETTTYTISYNIKGHGTLPAAPEPADKLPATLPVLQADGFKFEGWYFDEAYTSKAEGGAKITQNTVLYAKWSPVTTFTVSYNLNGHGEPVESAQSDGRLPDPLPTLTAEGHTFQGWYYNADCTQKANAGDEITEDVTLYAKWTVEGAGEVTTYTVTVNLDNGAENQTYEIDENGVLPSLGTPEKDGHTFVKWVLVGETGDTDFDLNTPITSDITIKAVYSANAPDEVKVSVTYDKKGHGTEEVTNLTEASALPPALPKLTEEGWIFRGWFLDEQLTAPAVGGMALSANTTLYAKWEQRQTHTEESWANIQADFTESQLSSHNNFANRTTTETSSNAGRFTYAAGVYFEGKDAGLQVAKGDINIQNSEKAIQFELTGEDNAISFTAKCATGSSISNKGSVCVYKEGVAEPVYKYDFTSGTDQKDIKLGNATALGGTPTAQVTLSAGKYYIQCLQEEGHSARVGSLIIYEMTSVQVAKYDVNIIYDNGDEMTVVSVNENGKVTRPANPAKAGYTFDKWVLLDTDGTQSDYDFDTPVTGEITLLATYTKNPEVVPGAKFTVTFDSNGGSAVASLTDVESGSAITKPTDPTRDGYTFDGWYLGSNKFAFGTDTVTNNITLVAHWTENGGSTIDPPTVTPGVSYTITYNANGHGTAPDATTSSGVLSNLPRISAEGYIFGGWYLDADCNTKADGATISKDTTVYAKWDTITAGLTAITGNNESITILWDGNKAADTKVEYKPHGNGTSWTQIDSELIREISSGKMRADIVGISAGDYNIRVTKTGSTTVTEDKAIHVTEYDRSGYAHFNYSEGIGAYKDDGTLKDDAIVIYVTDENKDTVMGTIPELQSAMFTIPNELNLNDWGEKQALSIGWWLNNAQYSKAEKDSNGNIVASKSSTTYSSNGTKLGFANVDKPIVIRFLGTVTTPEGCTAYNSLADGGSVGDNGHMARMKNLKNVTLEGIGDDATISGWGFHFMADKNGAAAGRGKSFEARNLIFDKYPEDALGMEGVQEGSKITGPVERCWIHNNVFEPGFCASPAESDKAEGDGACDFKRGMYYTLSYNYFEYCHKTNLVGSSDSSLQYNITMHHNWWNQIESRIPLTRQANVHFYNNYVSGDASDSTHKLSYVHSLRANCYIFSEANYYEGCKQVTDGKTGGAGKFYNNTVVGCYGAGSAYTNGIVTDREATVSNNCAYDGTSFETFDTNPTLFYYDAQTKTSKCKLETAEEARTTVIRNAGVLGWGEGRPTAIIKTTPDGAIQVPDSGEKSVTVGTNEQGIVFTNMKSGKGKGQLVTFTIASSAQVKITGSGSGDAAPELIGANGKLYAPKFNGTVTVVLPAGTYVICSGEIDKEATITAISFSSAAGAADERKQAFRDAVAALPAADSVTLENVALITAARTAYSALNANDRSELATEIEKYSAAINAYNTLLVNDAIAKIDAIGTVTEDSGTAINAAQTAYDTVPSEAKNNVTNYQTLVNAVNAFKEYAAQYVIKLINNLPDPDAITVTDTTAIAAARDAYENALDAYEDFASDEDNDKSAITNYSKLTAYLPKLDQLELLGTFTALLEETSADTLTLAQGTSLVNAYNQLTDAQKAALTTEQSAKYNSIYNQYDKLTKQSKVAIFDKNKTNLATEAGFTINAGGGSIGYKGTSQTFEYNGVEYNSPLKLQSGNTITFSTGANMKVTIQLHTGGANTIILDGTKYTADSNGVIEIASIGAGDHVISRDKEAWLCYVVLTPVA